MRTHVSKTSNITLVYTFITLVGCLIVISLAVKVFVLVRKSSFDNSHRFTILISSTKDSRTIYPVRVISVSPENSSLSIIDVNKNVSLKEISSYLGIPIDGNIKLNNFSFSSEKDASRDLGKILLRYYSIDSNLTILDVFRMWLFTRSVPASSALKQSMSKDISEKEIDKVSYSYFIDYSISKEKNSLQIVNGAEVSGLGNRLARIISNMGGNVVLISTASKEIQTSTIECKNIKSYTCQRFGTFLGFKKVAQETDPIADVIIRIGKNDVEKLPF